MHSETHNKDNIKDLIIKALTGNATSGECEFLTQWKEQSQENKLLFDELQYTWLASTQAKVSSGFDHKPALKLIHQKINTSSVQSISHEVSYHKRYALSGFWKIAAAVTLAFIVGTVSTFFIATKFFNKQQTQLCRFVAPKGSRAFVTLPDGTNVWLNASTKLEYRTDFNKNTRDVKLDGEAYFVVAKNKKIPFVVHTSDVKITALGTAFNVKAYRDDPIIGTTLDEGSVKIEAFSTNKKAPLILKPKQSAAYSKVSTVVTIHVPGMENGESVMVTKHLSIQPKELKVIRNKDTRIFTSWKESKWIFRHEQMDDLAKKLERRYDVTFVFKEKSLNDYSFTGSLKDESIEQVLEVIRLVSPISYKINHKTIELSIDKNLEQKYGKAIKMENDEN